jgi:hypothetical protein
VIGAIRLLTLALHRLAHVPVEHVARSLL